MFLHFNFRNTKFSEIFFVISDVMKIPYELSHLFNYLKS